MKSERQSPGNYRVILKDDTEWTLFKYKEHADYGGQYVWGCYCVDDPSRAFDPLPTKREMMEFLANTEANIK